MNADRMAKARNLQTLAAARGQSLAQLALSWVLRNPLVTSALIGASKPAHIDDAVGALRTPLFTRAELRAIDRILAGETGEASLP